MATSTAEATEAVTAGQAELDELDRRNTEQLGAVDPAEYVKAGARLQLARQALDAAQRREAEDAARRQHDQAAQSLDDARQLADQYADGRQIADAYTAALDALKALRTTIGGHNEAVDTVGRAVEDAQGQHIQLAAADRVLRGISDPMTGRPGPILDATLGGHDLHPAGGFGDHAVALLLDALTEDERRRLPVAVITRTTATYTVPGWTRPRYATPGS